MARPLVNDPIFVKTGDYASYTDFWRLAELSGFRVVRPETVALDLEGTYIFPTLDQGMMSCLEACPKPCRKARAIFWNLERPDANLRPGMDVSETYQKATDEILVWVDEVWVSDRLVHSMDIRPKFAVLGGHPGLIFTGFKERKLHDLVHIGQVTPRRERILSLLEPRCHARPAVAYGSYRSWVLARSRVMIGIDRVDGLHFSASLRWIVAAAAGLPVIQEEVADPYPLVKGKSIFMAPYVELAGTATKIIGLGPSDLDGVAEAARDTYCRQWTFRRGVEEALSTS